ncbi:MAG: hypothetical protein ABSA21_12655 [Candidatus Limnocylindrales bacterium]
MAAGYALLDETMIARPALGLLFTAEAPAAGMLALLPIGDAWTALRCRTAVVVGVVWLFFSPWLFVASR